MSALHGDNLLGKPVTGTSQHKTGKRLKKRITVSLKRNLCSQQSEQVLQGNSPVITKSFNLPGVAMIISTPSATIFTCSRLLPTPYTQALQQDTCLFSKVHFSEHINFESERCNITFPLINDRSWKKSNMTQSLDHVLWFMSQLTDGSHNTVSIENTRKRSQ